MKLYLLTLPGLDVRSDWQAVHDRLLDDFPAIDDVLPTTMVATVLIAYRGSAQIDGWLDAIDEALLGRRQRSAGHPLVNENARLASITTLRRRRRLSSLVNGTITFT